MKWSCLVGIGTLVLACDPAPDGIVDEQTEEVQSLLYFTPVNDPAVTTTCLAPGESYVILFDAHVVGDVILENALIEIDGSAAGIVSADILSPGHPEWSRPLVKASSPDSTKAYLAGIGLDVDFAGEHVVRMAVRVFLDAPSDGEVSFSLHGMDYSGGMHTQTPIQGSTITLSSDAPCP